MVIICQYYDYLIIPVSSASGSGGSASSAYSSEKKDKDSDSTIEEGLKVHIFIYFIFSKIFF